MTPVSLVGAEVAGGDRRYAALVGDGVLADDFTPGIERPGGAEFGVGGDDDVVAEVEIIPDRRVAMMGVQLAGFHRPDRCARAAGICLGRRASVQLAACIGRFFGVSSKYGSKLCHPVSRKRAPASPWRRDACYSDTSLSGQCRSLHALTVQACGRGPQAVLSICFTNKRRLTG